MMIRLISIFVIAALCFPGISSAVGRQAPEPTADSAYTAQEAEAAALAYAGLTADQVSDVRTEYDIDDGRAEYDVEFRDGDWEYEYTVDAETGEVLEVDKDYDPPASNPPVENPPAETPSAPKPAPEAPAADRLTAAEAKAIALAHAGVTEAEVTRLRAEFDMDDGVAEWEVEFNLGTWEYEYEINADTGAILSWERDDD